MRVYLNTISSVKIAKNMYNINQLIDILQFWILSFIADSSIQAIHNGIKTNQTTKRTFPFNEDDKNWQWSLWAMEDKIQNYKIPLN
jgi:hypothetical protein